MRFSTKHPVLIIVLVFLFFGAGGVFLGLEDYYHGLTPQAPLPASIPPTSSSTTPTTATSAALPSFTHGATYSVTAQPDVVPTVIETSVDAPDGTVKAILKTTKKGITTSYTLIAEDASGQNQKILYTVADAQDSLILTQNAWSPDNKFVFLLENKTPSAGSGQAGSVSALVFQASGENFADGSQYIDAAAAFANRAGTLSILDVTGWDSDTLMHVRTQNSNGEKGPSFWFEIPSKAFIQLAG